MAEDAFEGIVYSTIDTPEERFVQLTFRGGQTRIFADGVIDENATARFEAFVKHRQIEWACVHFDSPGGSLFEGLRLGRAIRSLGFDTRVGSKHEEALMPPIATCASAAAYAFAGGVNRFFGEGSGRLGVHQFYSPKNSDLKGSEAQIVSGLLIAYLSEMGVQPSAFVRATEASATEMVWLDDNEAQSVGLANNGTHKTTAVIRILEGRPYLRLEQYYHDVTSRVIVFHEDSSFHVTAGIVTTPERSAELISFASRNYLELDGAEWMSMSNYAGTRVEGSVVWLDRIIDLQGLQRLQITDNLGIWLDHLGPMRVGATMNLLPVQTELSYFVANCG